MLVTADYLDWATGEPDNKYDLVFGSPPYEQARTLGLLPLPKGEEWVSWMKCVVLESLRICKGLVAFVIEGRTHQFRWSATPALLIADLHRAGVHFRKPPIFHRVGIPGSGGPDWLRNDYEFIICCTNGGALPWSDNTVMGHPPRWAPGGAMSYRTPDGRRKNAQDKPGARAARRSQWGHTGTDVRPSHVKSDQYDGVTLANPGNTIQQRYTASEVAAMLQHAGDVTHHKVGGGQMGSKFAHENEAPFPESVAEFFVRSFCPPGGITLDPFSGSGTTLTVCEKHGRRGVGVDIRQDQTDLAMRRLAEITPASGGK